MKIGMDEGENKKIQVKCKEQWHDIWEDLSYQYPWISPKVQLVVIEYI